ncbi:MAG: diguanylate cyclase [Firmicutes bacterium]|nr:diguanylate cyclase [Bacillota bacterium]
MDWLLELLSDNTKKLFERLSREIKTLWNFGRCKLNGEEICTPHQQFHDVIEFLTDATFVVDRNKKVVAWNKAMEEMTKVTKQAIIGRSDYQQAIFFKKNTPMIVDYILENRDLKKLPQYSEHHRSVKKRNNAIYVELFIPEQDRILIIKAAPLFDNKGNINSVIESIRDVTGRQKTEEKLKYITFHDPLTGVYNRAYFEQEMQRLASGRFNPVGVVVADIDGLKMVNDSMGHSAGDRLLVTAARIIQNCFRVCDVVSRIGGDEFAVLLPNCSEDVVEKACRRIRKEIAAYNRGQAVTMPLSLSVGYAVGHIMHAMSPKMDNLFKKADDRMYREKLQHRQSARSDIVNTLNKTLEARGLITEGHAERMKRLVESLAKAVALSERQISDLRLLAQFHDIGKVGLPDSILFKKGPLTEEERKKVERHSEIGSRIAQSAIDLAPIADWILKHHERWDGKGYPLGLKGEEIPLESRILAIASAYDAMISERPYREAMSRAAALKEIQRCAGSQFDPLLAKLFVNLIVLATTTSTMDSGLLDVLVPLFEKQSGYNLRIVSVGTGEALRMGKTGHADVLLVHAPKYELPLVHDQVVINYQLVMNNDFVLLGPPEDPAGVRGIKSIVEAFQKIAGSGALFISRGDDSGTDKIEKDIWNKARISPEGKAWYRETGQGMGAAIIEANEKQAYVLSDRGTYLAKSKNILLEVVSEGDKILKNIYHVMQVNPEKFAWINDAGARAFVEFMIDQKTQLIIRDFNVKKFGEPLFFPDRLQG